MSERLTALPDDFDLAVIADDSSLPSGSLNALRELAWRKAAKEPIWFLEQLWHVLDVDTFEWVLFKLRDYQREDAEWMAELMGKRRARAIIGKARQIGVTTEAVSLAFHDVFFRKNHPWLIASQGESEAMGTLAERVKEPYNRLPVWFRERGPALKDQNAERMTFDNGSSIVSIPATGKAGRSKSVYGVLLDEAAWVDNAAELFGSLDSLCYGPMLIFSTGNGMGNFFNVKWADAQRNDSEFECRFHPWWVVPGRGPLRILEDGSITSAWYEREKRKYRGREWEFYQENPASPDEMFAKTGRAALPIDLLQKEMDWREPEYRVNLDAGWDQKSEAWGEFLTDGVEADNELWVWELPLAERDERGRVTRVPNYVMAADPAEGLAHGDRTSIVVYNANTMEEAAAYRGHYPIEDLGEILALIGRWYYNALALPERNNQGILPIDHLRRLWHYPRIYRVGPLASIPHGDRTPRLGWITNKATKFLLINEFVKALKNGHIMLHDTRFLEEAQTFIADGKGGFSAAGTAYDDHVMGHMIGWKGVLEVGQYPTIFHDDKPKGVTFGQLFAKRSIEPDLLGAPIGGQPKEKEILSWVH
jgi:hypothetical protein